MSEKIIETERLLLRLLTVDDAKSILQLLNEASFIANIGDKQVRDVAGAINYINQGPLLMQSTLGFSLYACVLKTTNEFIGLSGLIKREGIDHPEVGFAFFPQFCRQGFGYESANAVINYAFELLQISTLQAICNIENSASNKLLLKLGYNHKGLIRLDGAAEKINLYQIDKNS